MEFEFVGTVEIAESEIQDMIDRIRQGETFAKVFTDIMAGHDDFEWEARYVIWDKVEKYINSLL